MAIQFDTHARLRIDAYRQDADPDDTRTRLKWDRWNAMGIFTDGRNRQEDEHNYNNGEKGPPPPFQPIYMGAVEPTPCAFVLPAHASAPDAANLSQVAAVSDSSMAPAALEMADR